MAFDRFICYGHSEELAHKAVTLAEWRYRVAIAVEIDETEPAESDYRVKLVAEKPQDDYMLNALSSYCFGIMDALSAEGADLLGALTADAGGAG